MAKIIGIGNALLDSEFVVDDTQLALSGLTKGNMTLASDSEQAELIGFLSEQGVSASKQASGGSAANSIFAMASLGSDTFYACRVGDDANGEWYLADLNKAGIKTATKSVAIGGTTGTCMVLVSPEGERTMQTHLGTSAEINENDIEFEQLVDADWLYLEGYLAMSPSIQDGIAQMRHIASTHQTKVAVSFADPAVVKFGRQGLDNMLGNGVDVVFCNREEALLYTGKDNIADAAKALLKVTKLAVVTNGAMGAMAVYQEGVFNEDNDNNTVMIETPTIGVVTDTNGAGDNFAGGFLYALSQGHDLATCGRLATAVASQVIQQYGARLPIEGYQAIGKQVLNLA